MTDVSKIYEFLAKVGNWQEKADCMLQDGIITKDEFKYFVKNELANWNGEGNSDEYSDITNMINDFWKSVDTKKGGKMAESAHGLYNTNALDSDELKAIERKVFVLELIEQAISGLSSPVIKSDKLAAWKNSIREGLENKIKTSNKSNEELQDYINSILPEIQRKATADYCAQDYIADVMSEFKGYAYGDDKTLKGIIDKFVQSVANEEISDTDIKNKVMAIIDAYKETATGNVSDASKALLAEYGYEFDDNSPLNGLQRAVGEANMRKNLESLKSDESYTKHKDLYEKAITEFINKTLDGIKFCDLDLTLVLGVDEFKEDEIFQQLETQIKVLDYISSDELHAVLTEKFSTTVADKVKSGSKVMADIQKEALEKAKNGEFNTNGKLDLDKVKEFLLEQISKHFADFYKGKEDRMSLKEIGIVYDVAIAAADKETDAEQRDKLYIDAAKNYCKSVSAKTTTLANEIKKILKEMTGNENYSSAFDNLESYEVQEIMTKIREVVETLGDVGDFKDKLPDEAWGGLPSEVTLIAGTSRSFQLGRSFNINGKSITSDRITYDKSGDSGLVVDKNTGAVTISTGANACTVKGTVQILIDNVVVGTKEVVITVVESASAVVARTTNANTIMSNINKKFGTDEVLEEGHSVTRSFEDLYNNDGYYTVFGDDDDDDYNMLGQDDSNATTNARALLAVKRGLEDIGGQVFNVLKTAGLDESILSAAVSHVIEQYLSTLMNSSYNEISGKEDKNSDVNANGQVSNHKRIDVADNNTEIFAYMGRTRTQNAHKVVHCFDQGGSNDSNVFAIYFKDFVDDIIAEYYALGGR